MSVEVVRESHSYYYGYGTVNVYPLQLHNNATESVTVSYGDKSYSISINKDSVTDGCTISVPEGLDLNAILTFTFKDKYCTGLQLGNWGSLEGYNWSSSKVTYSFTCTVQEFLNGVTLNFTR